MIFFQPLREQDFCNCLQVLKQTAIISSQIQDCEVITELSGFRRK